MNITIQPTPTLVRSITLVEPDKTFIVRRLISERKPRVPAIKKMNPAGFGKRMNCRAGHPLVEGNLYVTSGKRRCKTCHTKRIKESVERRTIK